VFTNNPSNRILAWCSKNWKQGHSQQLALGAGARFGLAVDGRAVEMECRASWAGRIIDKPRAQNPPQKKTIDILTDISRLAIALACHAMQVCHAMNLAHSTTFTYYTGLAVYNFSPLTDGPIVHRLSTNTRFSSDMLKYTTDLPARYSIQLIQHDLQASALHPSQIQNLAQI
jgi:hypothetical protein